MVRPMRHPSTPLRIGARGSPQVVRVRIAPSPTGIPHIGNTRTSLFNYAWAKHNNGKFILRIEDTDRARLVEGAEEAIKEILNWLSLVPDESYKQSERLEIYKEHAQKLLKKDLAFEDSGAIRFKTPKTGQTSWTDAIGNKEITFKNSAQEDFVILKSDGYPTYNFANVIDDHLMEITHTIRGDEFISSTPKHIMLYKAFGWEHPVFAHLPLILGPDKSKLSKRHGAKSVLELREEGYLKEAILNFMVLLGWTPPSGKELLSLDEIISEFDLKDVNLASPIFEMTKLQWFNKQWLVKKAQEPSEFATLVSTASVYSGKPEFFNNAQGTASIVAPRIGTLQEYDTFIRPLYDTPQTDKTLFIEKYKEHISSALEILETLGLWEEERIEKSLNELVGNKIFNRGDFFMNLRVAITGSRVSLPINDLIFRLGNKETIQRLKKAIQ